MKPGDIVTNPWDLEVFNDPPDRFFRGEGKIIPKGSIGVVIATGEVETGQVDQTESYVRSLFNDRVGHSWARFLRAVEDEWYLKQL